MKEEEIITLLENGKIETAFVKLYKIFPKVKGILKNLGATKDQSYDIFQDALVVLYQKLQHEDFKIGTSIEGYLINTSKFMFLKTKIGLITTTEIMELAIEESDIEQFLIEDKKVQQAEAAISQIGEKCREILISFYIGRKSMVEIAKQFSFSSENVAKTQKYKCLEAAKTKYSQLLNS